MWREVLTVVVCLLVYSNASVAQSTSNKPPSISGKPTLTVAVGEKYSFAPRASDPEGKVLTFSIQRKPAWASFNAKTGRLSGSPAPTHVGTYRDIAISVTDGKSVAKLAAFNISVSAAGNKSAGGSVTLAWMPPLENTDGSVVRNLLGYRIYYGRSANELNQAIVLNNPGLTRYVIEGLASSKWYFTMTAVSLDGIESKRSRTVAKSIG